MQFTMSMVKTLLGFAMVANLIPLVAGIITIINAKKIEKYGMIFGWNIAGAVVGFLGCGLITTVLCIICAVFANKDKRAAQVAAALQGTPVTYVPDYQTQFAPMQAPAAATPTAAQEAPITYTAPAPASETTSAMTTAVVTAPLPSASAPNDTPAEGSSPSTNDQNPTA